MQVLADINCHLIYQRLQSLATYRKYLQTKKNKIMPSWFSKWAKSPPLAPEQINTEFLAFARQVLPDATFVEKAENEIEISGPNLPNQTLILDKLQRQCAEIPGPKSDDRKEIYRQWLGVLNSESVIEELENAQFADIAERVYPKIVPESFFAGLRARNADGSEENRDSVPGHLIENTPFHLVFVIDFPDRVAYILGAQLQSYEVDAQQLAEAAFNNARQLLPRDEARELLESDEVKMLSCEDGHPTARLLILPEYLEAGEEFAVVIPSQDLLMLTDVPGDNNWNPLRQFARQSDGLPQPFRVSQNGLTAM